MLLQARAVVAPQPRRPLLSFSLSSGSAEVFARADDVAPRLWAETFGDSYKDFEYYRLIEETLTSGFVYRYLVLSDEEGNPRALQPMVIVNQDLTETMPASLQRAAEFMRQDYPRFMKARMLLAGCVVGDGKLGLTPGVSNGWAASVLSEALQIFADEEDIGLVTLKDFSADCSLRLTGGLAKNFTRIPSYPSLKLDFTFSTFDEYLGSKLSKTTRKGLRRKFRASAEYKPPITMEVLTDCSSIIDEIYPLYLQVVARSTINFEVFTEEYFVEAGRRMEDRCRFFVWRQGGRAIAFSFCTVWDGTIYDNDIGLDYEVAADLSLYHVTFRDILEWALRHNLRRYCTSPFNYDPKLHLRLELVPLDLHVFHRSRLVNFFIRKFARYFAPANTDLVLRKQAKSPKT